MNSLPFQSDDRGTALLEFAMVAPLLALLIAGMVDISYLFREKAVLTEAGSLALRVVGVRETDRKTIPQTQEDNIARARYQEAIDGARLLILGNGLNPDNYSYRMTTLAYPDGTPVARVELSSLSTARRFVLLPDTFTVSTARVTLDSVMYARLGSTGLSVTYGNSATYCS
ncbi:MAG: TadE/TadG family type IV pilus assembly protein [Bdellovibrionota bacterium]